MTPVETVDPKTLRSSVDAIAAQIATHNEAVANWNAKCTSEGNNLKQQLAELARDKPIALGEYMERNTEDFKVLYDQSGHISGYRTSGGFLSLFQIDYSDRDLQQYIAGLADKNAEFCRSRSR